MEDKRFTHIINDPKFRRIPKGERKVKIDKRFQSMFKDERFKIKYTTDKRGRPISHTSTEDLKRYYELSSEDDSSETETDEQAEESGKYVKLSEPDRSNTNQLEEKHTSDKNLSEDVQKKLKNLNVDYARGESALFSESSSDDESETEIFESEEIDHKWGELDADAERTDEATYRLAACNMDWDRIRAVDLMVLLNSFLPSGGIIKSVIIYPSEFGKKRMQEEDIKGPIELVESNPEENEENEEGSNYHMEKLRQYQLNRLKYYYAVITFDSANSANKIYSECDCMEYESSATKLDLRFIPDDMKFENEPKEICDKLPEINKYQPRFFTTTALQQAKVNLTWDETNPNRLEIVEKFGTGKVEDISEADLKNYLASSSGEEESESEIKNSEESDNENSVATIDKYKALLHDIEQKEELKNNNGVEMEISWGIDLKKKTEQVLKQKLNEREEKTPFQQYLEKRKEKQKEKREQRKKKLTDNENQSDSDIPSDIDMNDPYFAEEFKSDFKAKKEKQNSISDEQTDNHKQAELELLLMNEDDDKQHFSFKKIQEQENETKSKKKRKNKKGKTENGDDNFQINVEDERFSALFTSHHFNIDPTDSHYKKTKGMDTLINEKLKRRVNDDQEFVSKKIKLENKKNAELNLLVKSVKRKTEAFKNK